MSRAKLSNIFMISFFFFFRLFVCFGTNRKEEKVGSGALATPSNAALRARGWPQRAGSTDWEASALQRARGVLSASAQCQFPYWEEREREKERATSSLPRARRLPWRHLLDGSSPGPGCLPGFPEVS